MYRESSSKAGSIIVVLYGAIMLGLLFTLINAAASVGAALNSIGG